jgi:hypothetical protein
MYAIAILCMLSQKKVGYVGVRQLLDSLAVPRIISVFIQESHRNGCRGRQYSMVGVEASVAVL